MKNFPSQMITSVILVLNYFIDELHKPVYKTLGRYNFKVRDLKIYNSPSMAIVPFVPNDSKGIQLLNLRRVTGGLLEK